MEHDQNAQELSVWWRLSDAELALLETKPPQTRLGFTAQFIMYRQTGRFVERVDAFPSGMESMRISGVSGDGPVERR